MRKRFIFCAVLASIILCLCSCSGLRGSSNFSIQFIDVGQGDSALVECDGHCMLIDGGDSFAGEKVYGILKDKGVRHLDILAISHPHQDHIGGLTKALRNVSSIDLVISNTNNSDSTYFRELETRLIEISNKKSITIPHRGEKYKLGKASIEVIDVASTEENDSLVLLITYKKTRFLFTGDIEKKAQDRISDYYQNEADAEFKIDLMKIPHHGAYRSETGVELTSFYRFLRTFMPSYAVISVGNNNRYGHPHQRILEELEQANSIIYRTDLNGDITVKSDGKTLSFTTEK